MTYVAAKWGRGEVARFADRVYKHEIVFVEAAI